MRPRGCALADSAYGSSARFRGEVPLLGLPYAFGVLSSLAVRPVDALGRRRPPTSVKAVAEGLRPKRWREVTWLEGTKAPLRSRFALVEVEVANADPNEPARQRLLVEWPEGEKEPSHDTLVTLARRERAARARSNHESAVAGRADLRRPQGGAGPRPRRRSELGRLAAPCQRGARLLRARALLADGGLFPPRPPGRVKPVRSKARPERHFADSFLTVRLAIARLVRVWLAPFVRRERDRRARARGKRGMTALGARSANLLQ
jgi:hypothetical protein